MTEKATKCRACRGWGTYQEYGIPVDCPDCEGTGDFTPVGFPNSQQIHEVGVLCPSTRNPVSKVELPAGSTILGARKVKNSGTINPKHYWLLVASPDTPYMETRYFITNPNDRLWIEGDFWVVSTDKGYLLEITSETKWMTKPRVNESNYSHKETRYGQGIDITRKV